MADQGDRDRVREATDIVDLISEVTKVKKSGRSYMAICPFHEEKSPSMSVDRARGLYNCFGCGEGGDVFTFVQKTQGVGFRESLDLLARRAGIAITKDPDEAARSGRRTEAVEAIRRAVDVYHDLLKKAPEAGPARAYLRSRAYELDLVDEWRIGFASIEWDTLTKSLRTGGIADRAMIDAGLSRRGRQGLFDVFRGRLMFPIYDVRGDPVGFGGRRVEGIDPRTTNNPDAKYVNSADSMVYHKSSLLFGLDRARNAIAAEGEAVVVEGYTDVIAMHLAGVGTAVATCGTALGDGHFDLLRRFTEKVVLAFDSDAAGSKAALRSDELDSPFRLDLDLRVAVMPDGLDPTDLVQEGRTEELALAVKAARPLLEHRIEHEVAKYDLSGPEGTARALHAAAAQVRRVKDEIARREYARFVARVVGVELATVEMAISSGRQRSAGSDGTNAQPPMDRSEAELLRVILSGDQGRQEVTADDFTDPRLKAAFLAVASQLASAAAIDPSKVADPDAQAVILALITDERPLPAWSNVESLLKLRRVESRIDEAEAKMAALDPGSDAHSEALRALIALQQERRALGLS